jgi:DNA-binding response OmpR family regulator
VPGRRGSRAGQVAVDLSFDGDAGLERALVYGYDVIVLDRDLPRMHGDEVCAHLVKQGCRSRVLMLTAAATIEDRVDGLGLGADDYLPKPFAFAELVARVRALFRRAQPALPPVRQGAAPGSASSWGSRGRPRRQRPRIASPPASSRCSSAVRN